MQNEHFILSPMENYSAPAYPTRAEKPSTAISKLPNRWIKSAAIVACVGALNLSMLMGCAAPSIYNTNERKPPEHCIDGTHGVNMNNVSHIENECDFGLDIRLVGGGGAASLPFYVAYLTEHEAMEIIRNRLCEVGICFDANVPNYIASARSPRTRDVEATAALSLFDERTRQGIVLSGLQWERSLNCWDNPPDISAETATNLVKQDFAEQFDVTATIIRNPRETIGEYDWENREATSTFTDEERQSARQVLEERLLAQVDAFIEQLREEGILPP